MIHRRFLIIGTIAALILCGCKPSNVAPVQAPQVHESATFRRLRQTGELRCGYALTPFSLMKDPQTGAFYGMMVDFMNEVGRLANVKIVWDHEVDWGLMQREFDADKIDAMCAGDWMQTHKVRQIFYSNPFAYDEVVAVVRADDARFDGNLMVANKSSITLVAMENDASDWIAKETFPLAVRHYLAPMEPQQNCLIDVQTHKADMTFMDALDMAAYIQQNGAALKVVPDVRPVMIYPIAIPVAHGANDMVQLFNVAIAQMQANGFLDHLIDRYRKLYPAMYHKLSELNPSKK